MRKFALALIVVLGVTAAAAGVLYAQRGDVRLASDVGSSSGPLDVTVTLEDGASVRQEVGADGGTLKTRSRDGTSFTLEVPAGAVAAATTITMTPVARIEPFPFSGGLVGGVHLQPDGLRLAVPAMLTIVPAAPVPLTERTGFSYYGSGMDFHMYPLEPDAEPLRMKLFHFSGGGVGKATQADRKAQAKRVPLSPQAQLMQLVAEALGNESLKEALRTKSTFEAYVDVFSPLIDGIVSRALATCDLRELELVFEQELLVQLGVVSDAQTKEVEEKCRGLALTLDSRFVLKHPDGLWERDLRADMWPVRVRSDGRGDLVGTGLATITFTQTGPEWSVFCRVTLKKEMSVRIRVVGGTASPSPTLILAFEPEGSPDLLEPCPEDPDHASQAWLGMFAEFHRDELKDQTVEHEFRFTGWTHLGDGPSRSWHKSYVRPRTGQTFTGRTFTIDERTTIELRRATQ